MEIKKTQIKTSDVAELKTISNDDFLMVKGEIKEKVSSVSELEGKPDGHYLVETEGTLKLYKQEGDVAAQEQKKGLVLYRFWEIESEDMPVVGVEGGDAYRFWKNIHKREWYYLKSILSLSIENFLLDYNDSNSKLINKYPKWQYDNNNNNIIDEHNNIQAIPVNNFGRYNYYIVVDNEGTVKDFFDQKGLIESPDISRIVAVDEYPNSFANGVLYFKYKERFGNG